MSERVPERRSASVDRWEPLQEFEQATERMRRMLDDVFGGLGWPPVLGERAGWSPPVDVEECMGLRGHLSSRSSKFPTEGDTMTTAIMMLGKSGTRWHEISSMQMLGGARWSRVIPD